MVQREVCCDIPAAVRIGRKNRQRVVIARKKEMSV